MPTLKRLKVPLYYVNKRGNSIVFHQVEQSLFVRPDDLDIIEADIDIHIPEKKDTDPPKEKKDKKE
jgi:transcription termination factor NusB